METNWTLYESEKEKFKALFPASVKREYHVLPDIQTVCSDDGTSPGCVMYQSKIGFLLSKFIYTITVTRIIRVFGSPQNFLEAALEVELKSAAELKSCESTIFKGYPALEYEIVTKNRYHVKGIMIAVKNTLYVPSVSFWPDHVPEFEKFINSFEILR